MQDLSCSVTDRFGVLIYTVKSKCKIPMSLALSRSVTDAVAIYLLVWVRQKCNNSATPLKDLKLNAAESERALAPSEFVNFSCLFMC